MTAAALLTVPSTAAADPPADIVYAPAPASDGSDAASLAAAAADACSRSKAAPTRLLLAAGGTYDLVAPATPGDYPISLDGCRNLTIDGQGATFNMHGVQGVFSVDAASGVTVENLTVDWPTPPFLQGTVTAQPGDGSVVVDLDPGFSVSPGSDPGIQALMNYDRATRAPVARPLDVYGGITASPLSSTQVQVSFSGAPSLAVGSVLVMRTQLYAASVVSATHTADLVLRNLHVYTAPGQIFYSEKGTNMTVDQVVVEPTPGTNRLLSGVADVVHCANCRGTVTVTNSQLTSTGDDAINTPDHYWHIESGTPQSLTIVPDPDNHSDGSPAIWPSPGDTIELSNGVNRPVAQGTIASTQAQGDKLQVTFTAPLPVTPDSSMLALDSSDASTLRVSGNLFARNRARGILVHSRDASIHDNTFDRTEGAAILLAADAYFWEGPLSSNVSITNNRFNEVNNGGMSAGVISSEVDPDPGTPAHSNVTIDGNQFTGSDNAAVSLTDVSQARTTDNQISDVSRAPIDELASASIGLMNVQDVLTQGNTYLGTGQGTILCGSGCDLQVNDASLNTGFTNLSPREAATQPPAEMPTLPGGGGQPAQPGQPAPAVLPLTMSEVNMTPARWRLPVRARRGRQPQSGTAISFRLSRPANATIAVRQQQPGAWAGGRCVAPAARWRRRPRCHRLVAAGTLTLAARSGLNTVRFAGSLREGRRLGPGAYTLSLTVSDPAGKRVTSKPVSFTILRS
jgi:hypothetical protein